MKKIIRIASWIFVIICMAVIFKLSSQIAVDSSNLSQGVAINLYNIVDKFITNDFISFYEFEHVIRKCSHFTIYFILGLLLLNAFRRSEMRSIRYIYISFIICVLYAISDEIHQYFVPGRGPAVFDVFIDSFGSLVGVIFYLVISKIISSVKMKFD